MDIITQRAVQTAPLHLKGIDGNLLYELRENGQPDLDKPVRIHFYSPGSKQQAAAEARATQRALKRLEENDGKPNPAAPEVRRMEAAEDLAAVTHHFENLSYSGAGDAQGVDLYQAMYADPDLGFIANQSAAFLSKWGNFKPGSAIS